MEIEKDQISTADAFRFLRTEGFPRPYVERLLPEWWDNSLLKTSSGIFQFALFAKQRLGLEIKFNEQGCLFLAEDSIAARFKHRKDTHAEELKVVKNLGKAAASIATHTVVNSKDLPSTALELRQYILDGKGISCLDFNSLVDTCWEHGIPVLFLDLVPASARKMTGMVVNHSGRPTILLGFKHQHQSRQLFILAHELGHILLGHVAPNTLLIDEDLDSKFDTLEHQPATTLDKEESDADNFALELIRGTLDEPLEFDSTVSSPSELATLALDIGSKKGIDPGHIILSYAFDTLDWPTANQAMKFFENGGGALNLIRDKFFAYANLDSLGEESRSHLLSLQNFTKD